jgi:hydrogenase/urease accessory protein HupE
MHTHAGFRAAISLAGIAFLAYWVILDPTDQAKSTQFEWPFVIGFSAALLLLAIAALLHGEMIGGRWVRRLSNTAAAGLGLAGIANVFEDGFGMEWVFLPSSSEQQPR